MTRPICQACGTRLAAVNYIKNDIVHYRTKCYTCIRRKRGIKPPQPKWQSAGYKKKLKCDICGFRAKYSAQLMVYHIDGDLKNVSISNLRTVCLNCTTVIQKEDSVWKSGDLQADY
jgi:hypothetical protein